MKIPIKAPVNVESLLAWVTDNPMAVEDAFRLLNLIATLQIQIVNPSSSYQLGGNKPTIIIGDGSAIIPIPLQLPYPWGAPTGTLARSTFNADESTTAAAAYSQAQVQAINDRLTATRSRLAALITDLQSTKQAQTG